ncbi:hypothetical protein [Aquibium oceanicum]|uniref:Uncharacterized protein n=1 Tax=Aquibium oceanicum TaxID=1670800 RepID=A0A1L3SXS4_9HYPH|nr:hypothetical protein [Aquibium oceanicum]APH74144.1 hypothetical protein BSQ44_24305 [Aquibium oceanicum]
MTWRLVDEREFRARLELTLDDLPTDTIGAVTGPGRSGAVAAVYASHYLRVPFIPYGAKAPHHLGDLLIIDTATQTGKTLRKASAKYDHRCITLAIYNEPPRVYFWYEREHPQTFRHEHREAA